MPVSSVPMTMWSMFRASPVITTISDVDGDEAEVGQQQEEVDRSGALTIAEEPGIPAEAVVDGRRHRQPGQDRQRGQDEHGREVREMLERVVPVEAIRLGGHVERGVVDHHRPCLREDRARSGDERRHSPVASSRTRRPARSRSRTGRAEKVPVPGEADGVPAAGEGEPGGDVPGIVLGRPDAIRRHANRGQAKPFRAGVQWTFQYSRG